MDLGRALSQISEIHGYLQRSEVYRGYRPRTMALTGGLALLATAIQVRWLGQVESQAFVRLWMSVAVASLALVGGEMATDYFLTYGAVQKRAARKVLSQFSPALFAGAVMSVMLVGRDWLLLPGLWSVCFGLGIFSARPYLPRGIGWVGLWYLACGLTLLTLSGAQFAALGMGLAFGLGQLFMATVLAWNLERKDV